MVKVTLASYVTVLLRNQNISSACKVLPQREVVLKFSLHQDNRGLSGEITGPHSQNSEGRSEMGLEILHF